MMIAVFIFAIGVLGFASLQSRSLQATFDNGQRDQVVWLSQGLVDRIRMNNSAAALAQYELLLDDFGSPADATCDAAVPNPLCDAAVCTDVEMATFDAWDLYCSNEFMGAYAIKGLSVTLTCTDGACNTPTENLNLTTTWCARGVEKEIESIADSCDNTIAQMSYSMGFRP